MADRITFEVFGANMKELQTSAEATMKKLMANTYYPYKYNLDVSPFAESTDDGIQFWMARVTVEIG